jgi:pilus assembly protein CpaD
MRNSSQLLRLAMFAALMAASGCAAPTNDGSGLMADGAANHPITVEPSYRSLKVNYAPGAPDMALDDANRFDSFVADYRDHGNGSIEISVPNGPGARAAIAFFAERAASQGVPRDKILVSTHDAANNDFRIEINYIAYQARTAPCGDWSEDLDFTQDNMVPKNFGCAVQQNIAAMVADPRDLIGPRPMDTSDTARRAVVMGHYENGEITQATKKTADFPVEQSAGASTVGQ